MKPQKCPRCGSEPRVRDYHSTYGRQTYNIACSNRKCELCVGIFGVDPKKVVEKWNEKQEYIEEEKPKRKRKRRKKKKKET